MERYSRSLILFPGGGGGGKGGLCGVLAAREVGGLGPGHHWFNTFFNFKIIVDPKLSLRKNEEAQWQWRGLVLRFIDRWRKYGTIVYLSPKGIKSFFHYL